MEKADSMTLVLAKVFRSWGGTWSRCTVSVSFSPSARLRAALGFKIHQFAMQPVQRLLGGSVVFQRLSAFSFFAAKGFCSSVSDPIRCGAAE